MTIAIHEIALAEIQLDQGNANKGTERGTGAIESSIRKYGFGEAGTLDKHNRVIGGNKRTEVAAALDMEDAIVIDVDGQRPVFIRRTDLDLESTDDYRARELAYALNRTHELSLAWDPAQVLADQAAGLDMGQFFSEADLAKFEAAFDISSAVDALESMIGQSKVAREGIDEPDEAEKAAKIASDTPYVQIGLACDYQQRDFIMRAVRDAKEDFNLETTTQAIVKMCALYIESKYGANAAGAMNGNG